MVNVYKETQMQSCCFTETHDSRHMTQTDSYRPCSGKQFYQFHKVSTCFFLGWCCHKFTFCTFRKHNSWRCYLPVKRLSQRVPVCRDKRHVLFSRRNDGRYLNIWNPPVNVVLLSLCVIFHYIVYFRLPSSSLPITSSSASVMVFLREQRL